MNDLEQRLTKLQHQFDNLRIVGGEGVNVSGGIRFGGFTVETKRGTTDSGTTTPSEDVPGCTDPLASNYDPSATTDDGSCEFTGACCYDGGTCLVQSETDCTGGGGVYQGDNAVCDPNPCPVCPASECFGETMPIHAEFSATLSGFVTFDGDTDFSGSVSGSADVCTTFNGADDDDNPCLCVVTLSLSDIVNWHCELDDVDGTTGWNITITLVNKLQESVPCTSGFDDFPLGWSVLFTSAFSFPTGLSDCGVLSGDLFRQSTYVAGGPFGTFSDSYVGVPGDLSIDWSVTFS